MYFGEAAINENRINQFLKNAIDLQMKQLAFVRNIIEGYGNNEKDEKDVERIKNSTIPDIAANDEHVAEDDNTKNLSSVTNDINK